MAAGSLQMQSLLYNDSGVQSAVDGWTEGTVSMYMVFNDILLPELVKDDSGDIDLDISKKTINHFAVTSEGIGNKAIQVNRQVSCRADNITDAEAIQDAAFTALNRVKSSDGIAYFVANKMPVIRPNDSTDNYNAPLEVIIKTVRG